MSAEGIPGSSPRRTPRAAARNSVAWRHPTSSPRRYEVARYVYSQEERAFCCPELGETRSLLVRRGWQWRRSHLPQLIHRIVRPVRNAHLLENELLEEIVCFLSSHAVGVANHRSTIIG